MKSHIMTKYSFFLIILVLNTLLVKAQDPTNPGKQYIPNITTASPQVASMSKVGEIPIDISTGRINYTIPIFEIQEGGFTMPINLSYNYSGLLLDETPGYAGVGWTFNIGGSILHTINGLNDEVFESNKAIIDAYVNKQPPFDSYTEKQTYEFLKSVSDGVFDGEPDKYTINVGNINCSFYLDKNNNPIFLKNENYKIIGNSSTGFTLVDDQGINYIFNLPITATRIQGTEELDYNSSFLLTEINFPKTNNKIIFEYGNISSYNDTNQSQSLIIATNDLGNPIATQNLIRNNITNINISNRTLNKIITNGYTIELEYDQNPSEESVSVIKKLLLKNNSGDIVKNYSFAYSNWVDRRRNLLNVAYNGEITNQMEYDMTTDYPNSTLLNYHYKKDLWGYYNKNVTAVTSSTAPTDNPSIKPDFASTKIGALKKITYQTKGYSVIDYEPNSVYLASNNYNLPYDADSTLYTPLSAATNANTGITVEKTFTVNSVPAEIVFNYTLANNTSIMPFDDRSATISIFLEGQENTPIFRDNQNWAWENRWIPTDLNKTGANQKNVINQLGTYHLKAASTVGASSSLTATLKQRPNSFNQTVGGLRVKQVQNCDFSNQCLSTVYNYSQANNSTGVMLQKPEFYSGYFIADSKDCPQGSYVKTDYYNYNSIFPLSNFRGSPVLYKMVEKMDVSQDGTNNGKIIFTYLGMPTLNSLQDQETYLIDGLLDSKTIKDQANIAVQRQKNGYLFEKNPDVSKYVYSLESKHVMEKLYSGGTGIGSGCGPAYFSPLNYFKYGWKAIRAKNYKLVQEENTNYYHGDSLVQVTTYDYNLNSSFLKSQKLTNSKGEALETKYFYPQDSEMAAEPFRNELISKNMIGILLDTQTLRQGVKLSEQKTVYDKSIATSNLLLPGSIGLNKGVNAIDLSLDKKITYDQYDDKGNILQYTLESGIPVSIIWGYNKTQPIAKIENATYSQVSSYVAALQTASDNGSLTESSFSSLRSNLSNSMVNTYTYKPLIGVSCVTDPKGNSTYYDYDEFNRLKFIKDQDLNVLQRYCYNYKGQVINCSQISVITYTSTAKSGTYTKNNCSAGGIGSSVIYNVAAGVYTSIISQADADTKAQNDVTANGQIYANANGTCTFKSIAQSGSFTRNNCVAGGVGSSVSYSQAVGAVTSIISQADADALGLTKFNTDGQNNANANGTCTFKSIARSSSFTRNNCASGGVGATVSYSQALGAVTSIISQADADALGLTKFNTDGQNNANANGTCTFKSIARSSSFTRNNCAAGGVGSSVSYSQALGMVTSIISQADADALGLTKFNTDGQNNANANGTCSFKSIARSGSFTRNNCASGGVGSSVSYSQALGAVTSIISQADADALGLTKFNTDGQNNANANGTCTFKSITRSSSFTRNNCASGGVGSSVSYSQALGVVTSIISQADADALGLTKFNTDGQNNANANGSCTYSSAARSGSFTRNNCAAGGVGSSVTYSQALGAVTSIISQADADALGLTKFNIDGQNNANANGTCTYSSVARSGSFTRNNCAAGGVGSSVPFSQAAGAVTSIISQADADAIGLSKFNTDGQNNANANGTCTYSSAAQSSSFTRNNCASGGVGSSVSYSQALGAVTSIVSQADADALGLAKFNTDGQNYANANGSCTFKSIAQSGSFTRNNCASGGVGSSVSYSQALGVVTSIISQADADALGLAKFNTDGQNYANANANCTFSSVGFNGSFAKNNCEAGGIGSSVPFSQAAGAVTSTVSQADADTKGLNKFNTDGQANANSNSSATCTFYSAAKSITANKNNCGTGKGGSAVTYTVPAGTYSSTISQSNADLLAQNDISLNSQTYINANGTCSSETYSVSMLDYDPMMSKIWVSASCNSASHIERTISVTIRYQYQVNKTATITKYFVLPANSTGTTFTVVLTFVGEPVIQSFTIN